jgi:ABC-2 type transport system ATP-binding protein
MGRHGPKTDWAIRLDRLHVVRAGRTVIADLTLDVPRGQLIGLLGPSGCGKSTLMRAIVGVQELAGGTVEVLDEPAGSPGLRRRIGYLTQAPSIYQDLTVAENLRYFAKVIGVPRTGLDAEVSRLLGLVDLADHAGSRAGNLSGGQLSRVSLAAALVGTPELLVLDEPTVGLDPVLRRDLWAIFRRLSEEGVTLLVSSHVMDEAVRCDRLLLMRDGRMLADDTLQGVLDSTGTTDAEQAFLTLVDRAATEDAGRGPVGGSGAVGGGAEDGGAIGGGAGNGGAIGGGAGNGGAIGGGAGNGGAVGGSADQANPESPAQPGVSS